MKRCALALVLVILSQISFAQTHIAVPLGHPVYHVIEQAQLRGLCGLLPSVRPYSQAQILSIINEILNNSETLRFGQLNQQERAILEEFRHTFSPNETGLDLVRGAFVTETTWDDIYFSGELGFGLDLSFSGAFYLSAGGFQGNWWAPDFFDPDNIDLPANRPPNLYVNANHPGSRDLYLALDSRIYVSWTGDLGKNTSYGLALSGGFFKSPRALLGMYNNDSKAYDRNTYDASDPYYDYRNSILLPVRSYSEPLAYFPFTYKKNTDGPLWFISDISNSGHEDWPDQLSIGYSMMPELSGNLLNGHVLYRFARLDREWAGMTANGSLVLNQSAQPFLAGEITFVPFKWLSFSGLTGVLEYSLGRSKKETSQNVFSINIVEVNIKNYFHIDVGSSAVWAKRFEIGYLFPLADKFLYQNNIGDFDNVSLFFDLMGQYPGVGKIWASLFLDEANPESSFFEKSKMMYAYQIGGSFHIPWLAFSSITFSYTKNEPFNYTHKFEILPWYGEGHMETNYVNNGRSLGHYIPPNSDEILVRFDTMPVINSRVSLQYQLIRHGADYGDRAVAGSSLWSELQGYQRGSDPHLRKFFLHDGAYQWMHIFKLSGEYSFTGSRLPFKVFCEVGAVYSYFTDIDSSIEPNAGYSSPYSVVNNNPAYPHSLSLIMVLGVKIFPKW